ncbi:MAG: MFS transporter [Kouleothrix sp.]|jgi:MFS family permease|nr:MFS transporter [Kouleothrix sp.]
MSAIPSARVAEMAPSTSARRGRWGSLIAMAVAFVSDNTEGGLVNTLFPVIRQALGLGVDALGILTSISRFARMIFGPLWSMVADRYGRKRVLVIVTGFWGLWTAAAGLAQDFNQLLLLYSIGVLGTVAGEPIANGLLADLFEENERGKAYGAIRSIGTAGGLVLTPVIGQLANVQDGWRYGMYIMGGISLLTGLLIMLFVKEPERRTAIDEADLSQFKLSKIKQLLKTPTVLLLAGMLPFVTSLVLFAFFVTYFVDVRGWKTSDAAILYTVFMAGFTISSFLGGLIGDVFDKRFGPNGRIMLMQMYLVAFAVMSYLALQIDWGTGVGLYVVLFLFGLIGSIGFSGVVLPMVSAVVPPELSATAFALLFSLVQGLLSALLSLALGYLAKSYGLQNVMLWLVTVPYAINAVYWFVFYRFYPKDVAAQQARAAAQVA